MQKSNSTSGLHENQDPNISDYDEKRLVVQIKKSCSKSFKIVFMKYYEALFRFVWIRTHDVELTRDILQETYTRIWDFREHLDENKSLKAFLYQIANNLVIDFLRKNKTRENYLKLIHSLSYYESEEQYYTTIDVQKAINRLPEKLKLIVILSRFEGFNYMEIAEVCGVSFQTVSYRLNKALKLISKFLTE